MFMYWHLEDDERIAISRDAFTPNPINLVAAVHVTLRAAASCCSLGNVTSIQHGEPHELFHSIGFGVKLFLHAIGNKKYVFLLFRVIKYF